MLADLSIALVFLFASLEMTTSFPSGPPNTTVVCKEMFPVGHGVDAQMSNPPYKIFLSQNIYTPLEKIQVTVQAERGYFIRGLFLQARLADCSGDHKDVPIGTFFLKPDERYLKTVSCLNRRYSTVSHLSNTPLDHAVFDWYAPDPHTGHIYFRATVVKQRRTFWTNVMSEFVRDIGSHAHPEYCPVRHLIDNDRELSTAKTPIDGKTQSPEKIKSGKAAVHPHILFVNFLLIVYVIQNHCL
ncbi:hypothetical protein CHS0354_026427 [Potamilus streckersoni]|uniref:Reelin domain-containing protein n=1 Tax=Potamilus streckersoni TaxID=2493646 RepID=A0AAE0RQK0_9BIVA|nr:hypothetical protein CHS0354_026427 [Potamilus streckersoni]